LQPLQSRLEIDIRPLIRLVKAEGVDLIATIGTVEVRGKCVVLSVVLNGDKLVVLGLVGLHTKESGEEVKANGRN